MSSDTRWSGGRISCAGQSAESGAWAAGLLPAGRGLRCERECQRLSQISRLRSGEFGAEVHLPPVERSRGHISVGVELNDAMSGKNRSEQAGDDETVGGNSDRA